MNQATKLAKKHNEDNCTVPAPTTLADQRLPRRHFATQAAEMPLDRPPSIIPSWTADRWSDQWKTTSTSLKKFIPEPSAKPAGCDLPRKAWVNLNRIRTGVGRTKHFLHKIGADPSPNCECGRIQTMDHIIDDCPLYKSPHGFPGIQELDDDTIRWLHKDLPV